MQTQKSRRPNRFWLSGLFFILWAIFFQLNSGLSSASQSTGPRLVVTNFSTAEVITSLGVKTGDRFTIRYIHSVDKTPIFEEFRLDQDQGLVLEKTWFTMFGAGLGHWPGHGDLTQDADWITIDHIEQPLGSFILRIGALSVGHTIIYHNQKINLSRIAPGVRALVEFKLEK